MRLWFAVLQIAQVRFCQSVNPHPRLRLVQFPRFLERQRAIQRLRSLRLGAERLTTTATLVVIEGNLPTLVVLALVARAGAVLVALLRNFENLCMCHTRKILTRETFAPMGLTYYAAPRAQTNTKV